MSRSKNLKNPQENLLSPLSPQQQQAALLLVEGRKQGEIAEEMGIAPETLSRWKAEPGFRAELNRLLLAMREASINRIRSLQATALQTIEDVMTNSEAPAKDRLAAAFRILDIAGHGLDSAGIPQTLPATEEAIREKDIHEEITKSWEISF